MSFRFEIVLFRYAYFIDSINAGFFFVLLFLPRAVIMPIASPSFYTEKTDLHELPQTVEFSEYSVDRSSHYAELSALSIEFSDFITAYFYFCKNLCENCSIICRELHHDLMCNCAERTRSDPNSDPHY